MENSTYNNSHNNNNSTLPTEVPIVEIKAALLPPLAPYRIGCYQTMTSENPCNKPGIDMEIFDMLMKMLKWKYSFKRFTTYGDRRLGAASPGLLGSLARGETQVSSALLNALDTRQIQHNQSYPVLTYISTMLVKQPENMSSPDTKFFIVQPFTVDSWLLLLLTIVTMILLKWYSMTIEEVIRKKAPEEVHNSNNSSFRKTRFGGTSAWLIVSSIARLKNVGPPVPSNNELLPTALWLLFWSHVITKLYRSELISILTVPTAPSLPFETMDGLVPLLERKEFTLIHPYKDAYGIIENHDIANDGYNPNEKCIDMKCSRMHHALHNNPLLQRQLATLQKNESYVNIHSSHTLSVTHKISNYQPIGSRHSTIVAVRDPSSINRPVAFTYGATLPHKLRKQFDEAVVKILPGIPNIVQRYEPCLPKAMLATTTHLKGKPLPLLVVEDAFVVLCGGLCLSFIIWLHERYGTRCTYRNQSKVDVIE